MPATRSPGPLTAASLRPADSVRALVSRETLRRSASLRVSALRRRGLNGDDPMPVQSPCGAHRRRPAEPRLEVARSGRCRVRRSVGYSATTSPPDRSSSTSRAGGRATSGRSPRIDRSMTLLLAAVGAMVGGTARTDASGPYLRIGDAQPHLVLVLAVIVTIAVGLDAGSSGPSSAASPLMSWHRPLGSRPSRCCCASAAPPSSLGSCHPPPTVVPIVAVFDPQPRLLDDPRSSRFSALGAPLPVDDPARPGPAECRLRHRARGAHRPAR